MLNILSCLLLTAAGDALPPPAGIELTVPADAYVELVAGYDQAFADWRARLSETEDKAERKTLRKAHPTIEWWAKFETSGANGEGRALLWMVEHVRDKKVKRAEATEVKQRLVNELVSKYVAADWFGDVIARLPREEKYIGPELLAKTYRAAIDGNRVPDVRAAAMVGLGSYLRGQDDEQSQAEGLSLLEKVEKEFPGTVWATQAIAATIRPEDLEPGKQAPNFSGTTIDGHDFSLADYRGKVVLIDFYGFW